jgi:hypothetical protein
MPTYYKYAERNADSQVNWAEIGKGVSDMIKEETDIRVQKRAAIDESTRQFQNKLAAAPQGEFQDGNKFTNNFAHDMMAQQLIDTKLLKSGQMKLQDFTLRRQNYIDGTNQLFDLQKLYQDNYKSTMEGVNNGDLQAMNTYNMSNIEGFSDFSKSKAIINPYTGIINVGMMKANAQGVMELTNDVAPVNVLRGKILSKIPTFKVEEAMNNTVARLGKDIDYIYKAATTSGAGTVTKLLGIGAFEDLKREHPEIKNLGDYKGVIDNANSAIEKTMDGYFADPYHISSVLTQNTGKYHYDSYTYDKDVAAKDPSKLLLKINPNTGLGTLDEKAPNYKTQVTEARDWVKSQLLSKLDKERSLTVTSTTPYAPQPREESEYKAKTREGNKEKISVAGSWNDLYTAKTAAEKKAAAETILGSPVAKNQGLIGMDFDKNGAIYLEYDNPKLNRTISMLDENQKPISLKQWGTKGVEIHNITDEGLLSKARGGSFGEIKGEEWEKVQAKRQGGKAEAPVVEILPELFRIKSKESSQALQDLLGPTFKVTDIGGFGGNDVEVIAPNLKPFIYNANLKGAEATIKKAQLEKFIKDNGAPVSKNSAGAPAPNAQGVGSKYSGG